MIYIICIFNDVYIHIECIHITLTNTTLIPTQLRALQDYESLEKGKIIVYMTSVRIVRDIAERCIRTRRILQVRRTLNRSRGVSRDT